MAVYAFCEKCSCRRDPVKEDGIECSDKTGHKRFTTWIADIRLGRKNRIRKYFESALDNPKELADDYYRNTVTDYKRGVLGLQTEKVSVVSFSEVADEWWTRVVVGQNRIKDPNRSEKGRVDMWKNLFEAQLPASITLEDFEDWIAERRDNGIAINTINRDLKPARWILDYAVTKGYIKDNPMNGLEALKGGNIHDRWMTEDEVTKLIKASLDLQDLALVDFIAVGVNTGFRLANLERLTARDIDQDLLLARQTKSGNPYSVPISPDIEPVLRRLVKKNPTGPLLDGRDNNIGRRFRAAARKAGLYPEIEDKNGRKDNDRVTIHTLRHTFAVLYLKRGGDIYKLSKLLGHASVAITDKIYARFCPKEKLKEAPLISTPITGIKQAQLKVV